MQTIISLSPLDGTDRRALGRLLLGPALAVACLVCLGGCNTMEGAGKDVQAAGEAIEDAADDD